MDKNLIPCLPDTTTPHRAAEEQEQIANHGRSPPAPVEVARLPHEPQPPRIELELQNYALLEIRDRLKQNLENYADLYDFAPVGYFTLTQDGTIQALNVVGAMLLDQERSSLFHQRLGSFVSRETRPAFDAFLERVAAGVSRETGEIVLAIDGMPPRSLRLDGVAVTSPEGSLCRVAATDITAHKQMEAALRDREAHLEALIESTDDLIAARDLDGRLTRFNQSFARIVSKVFGISARAGLKTTDCLPEPNQRYWENILRRVLTEEVRHCEEFRHDFGNGDIRTYDLQLNPVKRDGQITGTVEFTRDITDRKQMEKMLRQYQYAVAAISDSISLVDQNYIYRIINKEYLRRTGKERDAIVGRSVAEVMGQEIFQNFIKEKLDRCLTGETIRYREWFSFANAGRMFLDVTYSPYRNEEDKISGVVVNARDITEIKQAENALRTAKEFSENLIASMQDGISVVDARGVHVDVNPALCRMTGFSREELIGMGPPHPYWPPEEYPVITRALQRVTSQSNLEGVELIFKRKDGERFPVIVTPSVLRDSQGNATFYFATVKDITDRKRTERIVIESKTELQQIYDSVPVMICQLNPDRKVIEANGCFRSFTGWPDHPISLSEKACGVLGCINSLDDPKGCGFGPNCKHCVLRLAIQDTIKTGHNHTGIEYKTILMIDGTRKDVVLLCSTAPIQKNNENRVLLSMIDITERKRAEDALRASLEEKTILLKEVHHRVKNNLQIVSSLLNLQVDRAQIPEVLSTLRDTQNRVRSMALLHEALYRSDNLARIALPDYVESLCVQLWRAAGPATARIQLEHRIDDVSLPLDQAVPCGLIVNELVSNALKHAFPAGRSGCIRVEVKTQSDGRLVLAVADDGVGLPPEQNPRHAETLGLQLVFMLAEQLRGTVDVIARGEGTAFQIAFPAG